MKRVYKETAAQMQSDFKEWADEWVGPICRVVLSIAFVVASAIGLVIVLPLIPGGGGGGGLSVIILLIVVVAEIILLVWTNNAYVTAREKIKEENKTLMNNVKYPR